MMNRMTEVDSATSTGAASTSSGASAAAAAPGAPRRLSDDLQAVLAHANGNPVSVRELTDVLAERGMAMVLIVSTFPFLLPVPTMGLSAPAGAAVAVFGACLMLGLKPWLPGFLSRRQISYPVLEKIVGVATRWSHKAEKILRPRLKFMLWPGVNVLIGVSLIFSGFFLALPLPVPFANAVPALAILLLLVGIIERDGVFVIAGILISAAVAALSFVLLYLLWRYGWGGVKQMLNIGDGERAPAAQPATQPATGLT